MYKVKVTTFLDYLLSELLCWYSILLLEFVGLDEALLCKSLKTLELQRKAEVIAFDGNEGVKFFWINKPKGKYNWFMNPIQ